MASCAFSVKSVQCHDDVPSTARPASSSRASSSKRRFCSADSLPGQPDVDGDVEVAAVVGLADGAGMPWPFSRKTCPFCVVAGTFRRSARPSMPWHLGLAAEHRHGQRDTDSRGEVAVFALEPGVRQQMNPQVEVAARRRRSRGRPRRAPGPASLRRRRPECARRPLRRVPFVLDRQAARGAAERLFERQFDVVFDVPARRGPARPLSPRPASAGAARRRRTGGRSPRTGPRSRTSRRISSSVIVRKPPPPPGCVPGAARRRGAALLLRLLVLAPVGAEFVVLAALLRVAEHLVRLVDGLEACLGGLVAGVDVGMKLARELPVRLLDFLVGGVLGHAERRVVVLEFHCVPRLEPQQVARADRVSRARRRRPRRPARASSPASGRSRWTASATSSRRCTPARLMPSSSTRCLISRRRSISARE